MTDQEIIATIRKILDVLHDPKTGFKAFFNELEAQGLKRKDVEYQQRVTDKQYELAAKYGLTKDNDSSEVKFRLSGEDVMNCHACVSCGQAAKAFCYVNSQLPKEEQLDLKVLFSTDIEHLIDAKEGHTLPCVKLSDGKWHAMEPQICPRAEYPGFQFVCDDVKVGGEIWHQLTTIKEKGRPYQITKIVTPEQQATTYSDFGKFLEASVVRKGKIKFICGQLKLILRFAKLDQSKDYYNKLYKFCKALNNYAHTADTITKIFVFSNKEKKSAKTCIEYDGAYYEIVLDKKYLSLRKFENIAAIEKSFKDLDFKLQYTLTTDEYIQWFESKIAQQTQGRE